MMNVIIFLVGLAVYGSYGLEGFGYLLGAVAISYAAGRMIPKYRWVLWVSLALNGLALTLMKCQPLTGMALPAILGISYFTLKIISYNVDVYRGNILRRKIFSGIASM